MNYMKQVAQMLGVKIGEEFELKKDIHIMPFNNYFSESFKLSSNSSEEDSSSTCSSNSSLLEKL